MLKLEPCLPQPLLQLAEGSRKGCLASFPRLRVESAAPALKTFHLGDLQAPPQTIKCHYFCLLEEGQELGAADGGPLGRGMQVT